jgi:hypothetical protein
MSTDRLRDFERFMSRHLVALTGQYISFNPDGSELHRGVVAFSGFVIEFFDKWFWVTAGHCLKDLEKEIEAGHLKVWNYSFADHFGLNAPHREVVPITYDAECRFFIDQPSQALDFGLIQLSDLHRKAMEKNGIVAVTRENWKNQPALDFEHYTMLGFPSHLKQEIHHSDGHVDGFIEPVMIPLDRLRPEEMDEVPEAAWFIGKIPDEVKIPSIVGMSGGPIYGFRKQPDGQWTYHIVALQSWWYEDKRIAFGCSLPLFAEMLHESIVEQMHPDEDAME